MVVIVHLNMVMNGFVISHETPCFIYPGESLFTFDWIYESQSATSSVYGDKKWFGLTPFIEISLTLFAPLIN